MWWLLALGCTGPAPPAAPYAVLHPPFDGDAAILQPFDHAPTAPGVLRHDGEQVPGISGHAGIDFDLPEGRPVRAAADGHVISAGFAPAFRCPLNGALTADQRVVRIRHPLPDGAYLDTAYAHLDTIAVKPRVTVKRGDLLGTSGQSGCAEGPHLHFAVWFAPAAAAPAIAVDPYATAAPPRAAAGAPPNPAISLWAVPPPRP